MPIETNTTEQDGMKYAEHHNELNFVTDEGLHEAFTKMTDRELTRICIALHNNEDDLNAVAEGMVEQIASEKRYAY